MLRKLLFSCTYNGMERHVTGEGFENSSCRTKTYVSLTSRNYVCCCARYCIKVQYGTIDWFHKIWSTGNDLVDSAHSIHKINSIDRYCVDPFSQELIVSINWQSIRSKAALESQSLLCRSTHCRSYRYDRRGNGYLTILVNQFLVRTTPIDCIDRYRS